MVECPFLKPFAITFKNKTNILPWQLIKVIVLCMTGSDIFLEGDANMQ